MDLCNITSAILFILTLYLDRYNMCSGEYPFDGANVFRIYESIREKPVEIPKKLDLTLQKLLEGMLTKDPLQRMSVHLVMKHE